MNTDPITLAREFLEPDEDGVPFDPDFIDPEWARRIVAPLARAVLAVADLADQMDDEAATCAIDPDLDDSYEDGARDTASRIREALNGGRK